MMKHNLNFFKDKKVLITGHTGFKGTWLSTILNIFGAKLLGYSNQGYQNSKSFYALGLDKKIKSIFGDINDYKKLKKTINSFKPEIIFHLAAQPLVSDSILDPRKTFMTNSNGTLNILDIVNNSKFIKSVVIITSDKCYKNISQLWGYRENEELGGDDPYSASKASSEIIFNAYQKSFFINNKKLGISSVRAGNVIGGGDWSRDRLIPDFIKSFQSKKILKIRMPKSTRPWQHVLEPLYGYLLLAESQYKFNQKFSSTWNFGPDEFGINVNNLLNKFNKYFDNKVIVKFDKSKNFKEAKLLQLNCDKAKYYLKWHPKLSMDECLRYTADWYKCYLKDRKNIFNFTKNQIIEYINL